ncbi:MAG: hypothetical protein AAGJ37_09265 [Pseudomonadota bacterium]
MRNKLHNSQSSSNVDLAVFSNIELHHSNVPNCLAAVNARLSKAVHDAEQQDEGSIDEVVAIVDERAILVKNLLTEHQQHASNTTQSNPQTAHNDIRAFAEAEYAINNALEIVMQDLKKKVVNDIASLNKSRKAIGQYTGQNVKLHQRTSSFR